MSKTYAADSASKSTDQQCAAVTNAASGKSVQETSPVSEHFLPQLRASAPQNRASLQMDSPHYTRGLGPSHPLIRDWNDRRERMKERKHTSLLTQSQQQSSFTETVKGTAKTNYDERKNTGMKAVDESGTIKEWNRGHNRITGGELVMLSGRSLPTLQDGKKSYHSLCNTSKEELKCIRKSNVHFTEEDMRGTASSFLSTISCSRIHGLRPSTTSGHRASGTNSLQSLTDASTCTDKGVNSTLLSSAGSFAGLRDVCRNSDNSLTSLPSLPLIQSSVLCSKPTSSLLTMTSGSSSSFLHTDPSERDQLGSATHTMRKRDCQCSVINLRIPFGKPEEWVPPQQMSASGMETRVCEPLPGVRRSGKATDTPNRTALSKY